MKWEYSQSFIGKNFNSSQPLSMTAVGIQPFSAHLEHCRQKEKEQTD